MAYIVTFLVGVALGCAAGILIMGCVVAAGRESRAREIVQMENAAQMHNHAQSQERTKRQTEEGDENIGEEQPGDKETI